jgi:NAD(P)-dependent dehydrogenase (short-subunit alcohol dehydrogenase family)
MFNAIGPRPIDADYATRSTTISYERFVLPLNVIVGSQFLTARALARHMIPRGRGAIVHSVHVGDHRRLRRRRGSQPNLGDRVWPRRRARELRPRGRDARDAHDR